MCINRGWTVRVTTTEMAQGTAINILYVAGFSSPIEAEDAVREKRSIHGERYRALAPLSDGVYHRVSSGEVREV